MIGRIQLSAYTLGDMRLIYEVDECGNTGMVLIPLDKGDCLAEQKDYKAEPLIQVKIAGDDYPFGFSQGRTMRNSETTVRMKYQSQELVEEGEFTVRIITRMRDDRGYGYSHIVTADTRSQALEITSEITNGTQEPVLLEMLSSFTLGAVTPFDGEAEEKQLILHRMRSTWSGEGRLDSVPLEQLELEPSWQKFSSNSMRYGQVGSMPVRQFVPFTAVEDVKNQVVWGTLLTHASSWQMEAYRRDEALVLSGGLADREFGHWTKTVEPGETFTAPVALVTVAAAPSDAVEIITKRLTENIRKHLSLPASEAGKMPLVFNEFCTSWGHPTEERLKHMAGILKGKGFEYFVIDAGWYVEDTSVADPDNWDAVGDWNVSKSRFPSGLAHTTDYIRSCGMRPGIWFEFEVAGRGSRLFEKQEWLLKRDGYDIVSGHRKFLDMRKPEVVEYLGQKVIGLLRTYGFGYLKVDYNENLGIGMDGPESFGEELRQQIMASRQFFQKIHEELPEVVIELCSSGGHRLVQSFLQITSMASFSDAHECDQIPIIAGNMHRMILPRQSQIWAVVQKEHSIEMLYYRMTGTMLGRLCLSGNVEELDERQWKAVQDGMDFYQRVSHIIDEGSSTFQGTEAGSYKKPRGWQAVVRKSDRKEEILAVVHSFRDAPSEIDIRVPWGYQIADAYHKAGIKAVVVESADKKQAILHLTGFGELDGAAFLLRS